MCAHVCPREHVYEYVYILCLVLQIKEQLAFLRNSLV